jgi:muramoyltetrapeptide carboxypeptidase
LANVVLKPPPVAPCARIAVVAPASSADSQRITRGIQALRSLGYDAVAAEHLYGKHPPYFSGTPEDRLADLHRAFADPSVAAIVCARGGYGSNYLLEGLDLNLIRAHPKPFFAYSDMTVLQTWVLDQIGLVAFHGPMAAADFSVDNGVHLPSFHAALSGSLVQAGAEQGIRVLHPGRARGVVYGGCLSILSSALGTPYASKTEGKLVFLEDQAEKPYRIDRMLRQMILASKFEGVRGFIFGEMLGCDSAGADPRLLDQVILEVLRDFDVPIAIGLRSGHVSADNVTLPLGIEAELILDGGEPLLRYLEPAVGGSPHAG